MNDDERSVGKQFQSLIWDDEDDHGEINVYWLVMGEIRRIDAQELARENARRLCKKME